MKWQQQQPANRLSTVNTISSKYLRMPGKSSVEELWAPWQKKRKNTIDLVSDRPKPSGACYYYNTDDLRKDPRHLHDLDPLLFRTCVNATRIYTARYSPLQSRTKEADLFLCLKKVGFSHRICDNIFWFIHCIKQCSFMDHSFPE